MFIFLIVTGVHFLVILYFIGFLYLITDFLCAAVNLAPTYILCAVRAHLSPGEPADRVVAALRQAHFNLI